MPHVYATVAELNRELVDGGTTSTTNDAGMLSRLSAVSRLIDEKMERSGFGSGFGPRIGTNRYDGCAGNRLRFRDDLISITTVTLRGSTASSSTQTPLADTDYYLQNQDGEYGPAPYRTMILHRQGIAAFGTGYRVTDILGTWGYPTDLIPSTTTVASGLAADAAAQTFTTSASPTISPGHMLRIGSEDIYVVSLSGTTATVLRGQNGTTAAVHANASTISTHLYNDQVREVCLRLAVKRWKARDAGADGSDDGYQVPGSLPRESEDTIIRRGLFGLRLKEM